MKVDKLVSSWLNGEITVEDVEQSLLQSMGGEKAIPSTGDMAKFGTCLYFKIRQSLKEHTAPINQAFGTTGEIAKYFGRNPNNIRDWLRKLENQGRINPIQGTPLREGAKGDALYKFAEVEAALREERINNKRKEQTA